MPARLGSLRAPLTPVAALQRGKACDIVYDAPQNMEYAGGPIVLESSLIHSKRSPAGWRLLSSRKLQYAAGVYVPQENVHPPAEFWEDGEAVRVHVAAVHARQAPLPPTPADACRAIAQPVPPAPLLPLSDEEIDELEARLQAEFRSYLPNAVDCRIVRNHVCAELVAPGQGADAAKRDPRFGQLKEQADKLIRDASTSPLMLTSLPGEKWLLHDEARNFWYKFIRQEEEGMLSARKRRGDELAGSTPKARRGDDGAAGGSSRQLPRGGGVEQSVYSREHRIKLRDWTGAETTGKLAFNSSRSKLKVTVTPDEPNKLGSTCSVQGVTEAYECATLKWDADNGAMCLTDRELFDAGGNTCAPCSGMPKPCRA
jgi:hypothetical protein